MARHSQSAPNSDRTYTSERAGLRLGVFGWVCEGGGSVSSAHFLLCRALLDAGHHLDFYADPSFIPEPAFEGARFDYVPVQVKLRGELDPDRFAPGLRVLVSRLTGMRRTRRYCEHGMIVAQSRHLVRPYDAMLFLGTPPGPTIGGVPTIVWPRTTPHNELKAVRELSTPIARVSGVRAYLKLRPFYEVKGVLFSAWARRHPLILASQAAGHEAVAFSVPAERTCVARYRIDLQRQLVFLP